MKSPTLLVAATLSMLATSAVSSAQVTRGLFLLDRSGSMVLGAPPRCDTSLAQCQADIANFYATFPTGLATIREFTSNLPAGVQQVGPIPWHNNAVSADAAVAMASPCGGLTPLADAICDSVQAVIIAGGADQCFVYVYSDGGENNSMSACSGAEALNALTGRCPADILHPGMPFSNDVNGFQSWQQKACTAIETLGLACPLVFNVYKFNDFAGDGVQDAAFQFLDSVARASGGLTVQVDDGAGIPGTGLQICPTPACADASGAAPIIQTNGIPALGEVFTVLLNATPGRDRWLLLGFNQIAPAIDLAVLAAPGCGLAVTPDFSIQSPLLPILMPNDPANIGLRLYFQGLAIDSGNPFQPDWLQTSGLLKVTIQR